MSDYNEDGLPVLSYGESPSADPGKFGGGNQPSQSGFSIFNPKTPLYLPGLPPSAIASYPQNNDDWNDFSNMAGWTDNIRNWAKLNADGLAKAGYNIDPKGKTTTEILSPNPTYSGLGAANLPGAILVGPNGNIHPPTGWEQIGTAAVVLLGVILYMKFGGK